MTRMETTGIVLEQPELLTERLRLRPFTHRDAPAVERLAGAREVAATTLTVPHPYPPGAAARWIATHAQRFAEGAEVVFASTLRETDELVGAVGMVLSREHRRAEIGYWVGVPFWNRGYCTEAARAVVRYGFETLGLARVHAVHFSINPASGAVMRKLGMTHEGRMRRHVVKWGELLDIELYGVLREEF